MRADARIAGPQSLAITNDGRTLYAAGSAPGGSLGTGSLAVFARDRGSGALTQLDGTSGCLSEDGSAA
jgi:6-phosphogluconolactonase (cycloisomerase 2 family)